MTRDDVLIRARKAIGQGCIYKLGRGGMRPNDEWPWNTARECDCSGFVAWVLGVSRKTDHPYYRNQNGGWLETTAIARDAVSPFGMFDEVPWTDAEPGDVLVYGDRGGGQGHVGIVSKRDSTGPLEVIHCSKGSFLNTGDAIRETGLGPFRIHNAIAARCALVTDEVV